jgi:signal transduction histidine kinase
VSPRSVRAFDADTAASFLRILAHAPADDRALNELGARDDEIGIIARRLQAQALPRPPTLIEAEVAARTSELEAANRAKADFLANMSHELRTPLNGVIALADLLGREQTTARGRETAELIAASARLLEQVLTDILDFSKIEAGELQLYDVDFDVAECVSRIAELHRASAEKKGLTLRWSVAPDAAGRRRGDDVRITQILSNLLSNAVKFTEAGEVALSVEAGQDGWAFSVRDTGVGFSDEVRARLFRRFEQADGSITRRFGGTGLGLAICASLAGLMGGSIEAVSEPGAGSTFTVTLPLAPAEALAEPEAEAEEGYVDLAGLKVLLAEDHPTNQKVIALILEPLGVELTTVADGRAAVDAVAQGDFDVVLMDMQMPVLDGLSAAREIRAREEVEMLFPACIIALTANALPEHEELTRAAGMDAHMSKPIRPRELIGLLGLIARRSRKPGAEAAA